MFHVKMEGRAVLQAIAAVLHTGREITASSVSTFKINIIKMPSSHMIKLTAVCTPECQNGGACVAPGICNCLDGFLGGRCEGGMYIHQYNNVTSIEVVYINFLPWMVGCYFAHHRDV